MEALEREVQFGFAYISRRSPDEGAMQSGQRGATAKKYLNIEK